jgi:hypothetical protein
MHCWFFYGTLMDPAVFEAVTGSALTRFEPEPAQVRHFRKVFLPGQSYPTLIAATGARADGMICRNLPAAVVRALHDYEGPDYTYRRLPVVTAGGLRLQAMTYIARVAPHTTTVAWDFEDWVRRERELTLRRIRVLGRP